MICSLSNLGTIRQFTELWKIHSQQGGEMRTTWRKEADSECATSRNLAQSMWGKEHMHRENQVSRKAGQDSESRSMQNHSSSSQGYLLATEKTVVTEETVVKDAPTRGLLGRKCGQRHPLGVGGIQRGWQKSETSTVGKKKEADCIYRKIHWGSGGVGS